MPIALNLDSSGVASKTIEDSHEARDGEVLTVGPFGESGAAFYGTEKTSGRRQIACVLSCSKMTLTEIPPGARGNHPSMRPGMVVEFLEGCQLDSLKQPTGENVPLTTILDWQFVKGILPVADIPSTTAETTSRPMQDTRELVPVGA